MKFNKKYLYAGMFSIMLLQSTKAISTVFAADNIKINQINNDKLNQEDNNKSYKLFINSGEIDGTAWKYKYTCDYYNGPNVNFYVENLGEEPVIMYITDGNSKTLNAGEKGVIHTKLPVIGQKTILFKVDPKNGGDVHFKFRLTQV